MLNLSGARNSKIMEKNSRDNIVIFSGSAHPSLASAVCSELGVDLSPSSLQRFSNDCFGVRLNVNCREKDVFIIQPLTRPVQDHLVELLLMLDAARGASASRITAVIPYYAYARSDKKDSPRISIAARLVADLLVTAGANRVLTMTLHAPQVHGFFSVPVDHLHALNILSRHFYERDLTNTVVVSPDLGNAKSASEFARLLKTPVAAGRKQRISDTEVIIDTIVGDVQGKDVIVLDDEISSGGTIISLLNLLRQFDVPQTSIVCTHGLFAGTSIEHICSNPQVREIVTTDTTPTPKNTHANFHVASIAPLLAEAIYRIHNGESISSLFVP
jgi:ribose-phosphate pyrophosphokinase